MPQLLTQNMLQFLYKMVEQNSLVTFSEWLKLRRKVLDLTQEELANRAGCSVGALRKIEAGDRRPSKQLAGLIAKALEIPHEDQQTFVRVARGELNLERLQKPSLESSNQESEVWTIHLTQQSTSLNTKPKYSSLENRLPSQTTLLIGRTTELDALERIFKDPQCRLLTLTGVGGIGKTRLAIEFAARRIPGFPGGVFYIPLTPVDAPDKIVSAIADVLEFVFSGPTDPKEQLLHYISSYIKQEALFIFDNLEHLLVRVSKEDDQFSVIELVSEILQRLPNVKILGTSRERLNLYGEWTYELHGLSVPPTDFEGRLEEFDAAALFIKSAQRIRTDFQIEAEDQSSLVRICQLVEGVPLAIELAAAWVGMLSCQEIAKEIQSNMDFLTTSMRDIPERHRSIRATFDHSWKLLSAEEQLSLCQLSVFHGGFERFSALKVAGATLPLLASLHAKSLVHRNENGRYDLHEVIRQFAASHLDDHPHDRGIYDRHCEYYLSFVWEREKSLKSAAQQETMRQLTDEIDNIRAAWTWAIQHRKFAQLGQAGRSFGWYFEIAGLYREGIEQLELLVQAINNKPLDNKWHRVLGLAFIHQALLNFRKGDFDLARKLYEDGIIILRPIGEQGLLADALIFLGTLLYLNGEYLEAQSLVEEGLVFAQANNDRWFEAFGIYSLGHIASLKGLYEQGYEQMHAGLSIWRTLGDPHAISLGLNFFVTTLINLGRYEEAKAFMNESITLCEQSKNRWGMGTAYRYLGLANLAEGQFAEAKGCLHKSLEIFGNYFEGWDIARSLTYLGDASLSSGDLETARKDYLDALRLSMEVKAIPIVLDALAGLGNLQAQSGKAEQALLLCYAILNHSSSEEETKRRAARLCTDLENKLDPKQVYTVRTMASKKALDKIVTETLEIA